MNVTFDVKLTPKDLFTFNMRQSYRGMQGVLSIVLPLLLFVQAGLNYKNVSIGTTLLYVGLGTLFLVYVPISLWGRANKALKTNSALANTLHFTFAEDAICVTQGNEKAEFKWENIYKMISTKSQVLIYTNRINAYVIPKTQITEQYTELAKLANVKLEKHRVQMK